LPDPTKSAAPFVPSVTVPSDMATILSVLAAKLTELCVPKVRIFSVPLTLS